jgi:hemin uptake protein HemP
MSMSILSNESTAAQALGSARPLRLLNLKPSSAPLGNLSIRRISSQMLLDGARELVIQHQGGEYPLRLTRNDKLILTK